MSAERVSPEAFELVFDFARKADVKDVCVEYRVTSGAVFVRSRRATIRCVPLSFCDTIRGFKTYYINNVTGSAANVEELKRLKRELATLLAEAELIMPRLSLLLVSLHSQDCCCLCVCFTVGRLGLQSEGLRTVESDRSK